MKLTSHQAHKATTINGLSIFNQLTVFSNFVFENVFSQDGLFVPIPCYRRNRLSTQQMPHTGQVTTISEPVRYRVSLPAPYESYYDMLNRKIILYKKGNHPFYRTTFYPLL